MSSKVAAKRFTVDEFQRMAQAGVFDEDDRLELLDGEIIQMNPGGRRHVAMVNRLTRLFARVLGDRALISVQNPLVLDPAAEPQPDLVLLRPREDDYEAGLPTGADALLVVEVADTTLGYDTTRKARAYARGGVPVVWVIALGRTGARDRMLVLADPTGEGYNTRTDVRRGDVLSIPGLPGVSISISEFL
jgi:Uma2 family endonuclease